MNIEEICYNLQPGKICRDTININYLQKFDYDICDYITQNTPNINHVSCSIKRIFKNYAMKRSLDQIQTFNEDNYQKLLSIIKQVKFIKDYPLCNCAVATSFDIISNNTEKKIQTPGYTSAYHLPIKTYDIDIISLGHEHCHTLKETNYIEHKNQLIIGEVIPIFYELINYENNPLKIKHLEYRLFWLTEQKEIYLTFSNILKENINNNKLSFLNNDVCATQNMYEYAKSYFGCYLGAFYYALILYNIYKKEPIKILSLINDVLSHKITTLDMLKELNIYCNIQGETFELEITNIKKVLSK